MKGEKVTGQDVYKLRERTGASIVDCKKALIATDNDEDAAIKWLKENMDLLHPSMM